MSWCTAPPSLSSTLSKSRLFCRCCCEICASRSCSRALIFLQLGSSGAESQTLDVSISFTMATIISPCTRSCRRTPSMKTFQFVAIGSGSFSDDFGK